MEEEPKGEGTGGWIGGALTVGTYAMLESTFVLQDIDVDFVR